MRPTGSQSASCLALAALVAAVLTTGCYTLTATYRDPREFERRKTEEVLVVAERPARPHIVIASLDAEAEGRTHSRDDLVAKLRREAARLGGDALVVYADANTRQFVAAGLPVGTAPTTRQRHVLADVVVFTDRAEGSRAPLP